MDTTNFSLETPEEIVTCLQHNAHNTVMLGLVTGRPDAAGMTLLHVGIAMGAADPALARILLTWFDTIRAHRTLPQEIIDAAHAEVDDFVSVILRDVGRIAAER